MLANWLIYISIGKILVYLGMQFPLPSFLKKIKSIEYLHGCDLCFGVWVFGFLALFMQMDLLTVLGFQYVPVLSQLVTGGAISFIVHLLSLGWKAKFEVIVV